MKAAIEQHEALDLITRTRADWLAAGYHRVSAVAEDRRVFYSSLRYHVLPKWVSSGKREETFIEAMQIHAREEWMASGGDPEAFDKNITSTDRRQAVGEWGDAAKASLGLFVVVIIGGLFATARSGPLRAFLVMALAVFAVLSRTSVPRRLTVSSKMPSNSSVVIMKDSLAPPAQYATREPAVPHCRLAFRSRGAWRRK